MPSVYDVKPRFQALLRPLVARLVRSRVTANQVTLAAMMLSVFTGGIIALFKSKGVLLLLPMVLLVRMAMNAIDGMLAREHGQKTALGGLLNELGDVISDIALYLGLVPPLQAPVLLVAIVLAAITGELAGIAAVTIGATRRYDGPMGKSDRALAFGILAVVAGVGHPAHWEIQAWLSAILVLAVATVWNRCRCALKEIGNA